MCPTRQARARASPYRFRSLAAFTPDGSPDGKELFYVAPDGKLMAAPITVKSNTLEPGTPVALFQTRIVGGGAHYAGFRQQYDVAPDGRFLVNVESESAAPINLILGWKPTP